MIHGCFFYATTELGCGLETKTELAASGETPGRRGEGTMGLDAYPRARSRNPRHCWRLGPDCCEDHGGVDPFLAEVVDDARVPHGSEENAANTGSKGLTRGSHASVGGRGYAVTAPRLYAHAASPAKRAHMAVALEK
jgi:hypothetical protein